MTPPPVDYVRKDRPGAPRPASTLLIVGAFIVIALSAWVGFELAILMMVRS